MTVFLDTSVIIAALPSPQGGSGRVIEFCEAKIIKGVISLHVIDELHGVSRRKLPELFDRFKKLLKAGHFTVVRKIPPALVKKAKQWILYEKDAQILAGAKHAEADILITLDIKHFIYDPAVSKNSGITILTPGDFLRMFVQKKN